MLAKGSPITSSSFHYGFFIKFIIFNLKIQKILSTKRILNKNFIALTCYSSVEELSGILIITGFGGYSISSDAFTRLFTWLHNEQKQKVSCVFSDISVNFKEL